MSHDPAALGMAAAARTEALRPLPGLIGIFGNSQAENNHSAGSFVAGTPCALQSPNPREDKSSAGFAVYLEMLSGGRVELPRSLNYGVSGYNTNQLLPMAPAAAAAMKAGGASSVILILLANDATTGMTFAQTIANAAAIENIFLAQGLKVIWLAEYPRGNAANTTFRYTGSNLQDHQNHRHWIKGRANNKTVFTVDPWPVLCDPISILGEMRTGLSTDYLHLQGPGSLLVAQLLLPLIQALYPARDPLFDSNTDLYSANNPYGSIHFNPMLDGTGGGKDAGNTGVLATTWGQGGTPSGVTAVLSKITDTDGYPGQRFQLSGTPAAGNTWELLRQDVTIGTNALAIGSVVKAMGEMKVAAGATGLLTCYFSLAANTNSCRAPSPFGTATDSILPTSAFSGPVILPSITIPTGTTVLRLSMFVTLIASATLSADITVKRFGSCYV